MRQSMLFLLWLFSFASCNTTPPKTTSKSEPEPTKYALKSPADFFSKDRAQILVVGAFHFDYPGLDDHQISESDKIDVLSPKKQKEMTELVEYIKRFKPNKIAIEATEKWQAGKKLRLYKSGNLEEGNRDERYQLAIRIAAELKLDTLYSIDASNLLVDMKKTNKDFVDKLSAGSDSVLTDSLLLQQYKDWRSYSDKLMKELSLLAFFKYLNSKEYHQFDYGNYLIDFFKLEGQRGADILSLWWYNRNLRIFSKIQALTETKQDRILVFFGNGHAAVLRQLLESSVEYDFIEFDSL
jgi:hypothetical protein